MNKDEYEFIKQSGDAAIAYHKSLERSYTQAEMDLSRSRGLIQDYNKCISLFQTWISKITDQNINSISELVTNGLSHVVEDQNLEFKITQELKNNKSNFKISMVNSGRESDPVDGSGGGIASLVSTIIRFSLTAKFGLSKIILLDETLSSLSNSYVPAAATFLRELCKEFNIDILMVTHNSDFIQESDTAYEAINNGKLKLKRIK